MLNKQLRFNADLRMARLIALNHATDTTSLTKVDWKTNTAKHQLIQILDYSSVPAASRIVSKENGKNIYPCPP